MATSTTDKRLQLSSTFRFVHEPVGTTASASEHRFVGREKELRELTARILLSDGGAFMVTGYRGVGKSSFVNQVIAELRRELAAPAHPGGNTEIVDVYLNFARPITAVELMFHILRSLHHRLEEVGLLAKLPADLRSDLWLACQRTSLTIGLKSSTRQERGIDLGDIPLVSRLVPLKLSAKRTRETLRDVSYIAYDEKTAEYDLIRLARRISLGTYGTSNPWWRPFAAALPRTRIKMIFIFDELDKLDEGRQVEESSALDDILGTLKTLFTTSGVTFLFVAGKSLYDRLVEDVGRGDSIYESVFTYARYLPALWQHSDAMCDPLIDAANGSDRDPEVAASYGAFKKFLAFKGRGIPRRILRGFNDQVHWNGERAALVFNAEDRRKFRFYAGLYDKLTEQESRILGRAHDDASEERDRQRLAVYYLTDWILQRGEIEFSTEEAIAASRRLSRVIAPLEESAPHVARALIDVFVEHRYLDEVSGAGRAQIISEGGRAAGPTRYYRMSRRRVVEMGSEAGLFEQEARSLADAPGDALPADRYRVLRTLGRGGMAEVKLAVDKRLDRVVAIKQLRSDVSAAAPELHERLRREARLLRELRHPSIVSLYDDALDAPFPYLVMEYLEGLSLAEIITQEPLTEVDRVLKIVRDVALAMDYMHGRRVLWRDAKPANVMLTPDGRVVLFDFGIAKSALATDLDASLTQHGSMIGTIGYMAPELFRGEPATERSDLYGLGVTLFEMVTGRLPFDSASAGRRVETLAQAAPPPSQFAPVPPLLDTLTLQLLAIDPQDRFESARALLSTLPDDMSTVDLTALSDMARARQHEVSYRERESTAIGGFGSAVLPVVGKAGDTMTASPHAEPAAPPPPVPVMMPRPVAPPPPVPASPVGADTQTISLESLAGTWPRLQLADGAAVPLRGERVTIGRSRENDIVLDELKASRFQAMLIRSSNAEFELHDLNSVNGTMLNGEPVKKPMPLRSGDRISIGSATLTYEAVPDRRRQPRN